MVRIRIQWWFCMHFTYWSFVSSRCIATRLWLTKKCLNWWNSIHDWKWWSLGNDDECNFMSLFLSGYKSQKVRTESLSRTVKKGPDVREMPFLCSYPLPLVQTGSSSCRFVSLDKVQETPHLLYNGQVWLMFPYRILLFPLLTRFQWTLRRLPNTSTVSNVISLLFTPFSFTFANHFSALFLFPSELKLMTRLG